MKREEYEKLIVSNEIAKAFEVRANNYKVALRFEQEKNKINIFIEDYCIQAIEIRESLTSSKNEVSMFVTEFNQVKFSTINELVVTTLDVFLSIIGHNEVADKMRFWEDIIKDGIESINEISTLMKNKDFTIGLTHPNKYVRKLIKRYKEQCDGRV